MNEIVSTLDAWNELGTLTQRRLTNPWWNQLHVWRIENVKRSTFTCVSRTRPRVHNILLMPANGSHYTCKKISECKYFHRWMYVVHACTRAKRLPRILIWKSLQVYDFFNTTVSTLKRMEQAPERLKFIVFIFGIPAAICLRIVEYEDFSIPTRGMEEFREAQLCYNIQ